VTIDVGTLFASAVVSLLGPGLLGNFLIEKLRR
jgi:hypothetical protein